jgi:flagellin-like protein
MKGVNEIIAIILILMIVIALAALAYIWFSGIFRQLTLPPSEVLKSVIIKNVSSHDVVLFMKSHGCDSLFLWADGTLNCMKNDCIGGGYCKMNYVLIKE